MPKPSRNYFSYLFRAWREHDEGDWRFSLESVFGEERINFSDFAGLVAFLASKVGAKNKGKRKIAKKQTMDDKL